MADAYYDSDDDVVQLATTAPPLSSQSHSNEDGDNNGDNVDNDDDSDVVVNGDNGDVVDDDDDDVPVTVSEMMHQGVNKKYITLPATTASSASPSRFAASVTNDDDDDDDGRAVRSLLEAARATSGDDTVHPDSDALDWHVAAYNATQPATAQIKRPYRLRTPRLGECGETFRHGVRQAVVLITEYRLRVIMFAKTGRVASPITPADRHAMLTRCNNVSECVVPMIRRGLEEYQRGPCCRGDGDGCILSVSPYSGSQLSASTRKLMQHVRASASSATCVAVILLHTMYIVPPAAVVGSEPPVCNAQCASSPAPPVPRRLPRGLYRT